MMNLRRWLTIVVLTLAAVSLRAASPADETAETIINNLFAQLDRVADVVLTVKDEDTANKAADQLKLIDDKMHKIIDRAMAAPEPSKEEQAVLQDRMKTKIQEFMGRINGAKDQLRAAGPIAGLTVGKAMMSLGQSLQTLGNKLGNHPVPPVPAQPAGGN